MLSLRIKLTVYYLAILSAVLLLFGVAIFFYLSRSLLTTIDESLAFQVERLEMNMAAGPGTDAPSNPPTQGANHEGLLHVLPHIVQIIEESGHIADENF